MNCREEAERLVKLCSLGFNGLAVQRLSELPVLASAAIAVQMTLIMLDDPEMVADGALPAFLEALEAGHV